MRLNIYDKLVLLCVVTVLLLALNVAHDQGRQEGRQEGFVKGWAEGHEKRLMEDMDRLCI